jgi:hypothetical protein
VQNGKCRRSPGSTAFSVFSCISGRSLAQELGGSCILQGGKLLRYHVVDVDERASPQASWSVGELVIQVIVIHVPLATLPVDHAKMAMALVKFVIGNDFSAFPARSINPEAIESIAKER